MICIKKRIFLNKIDSAKETLDENSESHNPKNDENEDPSQESTINPEVRGTNKKSQANSNGPSQANFTENQTNEVIYTFFQDFCYRSLKNKKITTKIVIKSQKVF
jgi:hypothetical protein